jgi:hypothetical protein
MDVRSHSLSKILPHYIQCCECFSLSYANDLRTAPLSSKSYWFAVVTYMRRTESRNGESDQGAIDLRKETRLI